MKKRIAYIIATWFGSGYFPIASATAGSAATLPLAFIAAYFGGLPAVLVSAIVVYIVGTYATKEVLKYTKHDPSIVVVDEAAGQLVALLPFANYLQGNLESWWIYIAAFFLFRLFDIVKPWPANYFDRKVINVHGVMLDDIVAGVYTALVLWGLTCLF
ncbi:MAG: phosphatidylglycerophosphatase A [Alphaproteobacteria bacterium]|nr:phosphatidylglycerophosphatase A [Alphaproteobacteria bacterium]